MSFSPDQFLDTAQAFTSAPIIFNIVGLLDISTSKLTQRDKWKDFDDPQKASVDRLRNGRNTIIRELRDDDENNGNPVAAPTNAYYKLTLRDQNDNLCFAYEYNDRLPFLRQQSQTDSPLQLPLGGRLRVEKGTMIKYGVLMLNRVQCQYIGFVNEDRELYTNLNLDISKKHIEFFTEELG